MLRATFLLAFAFGAAQGRTTGSCDQVFTIPFEPGQKLTLDLRPGNIDVIGTSEPEIRVACRLDAPELAREVSIVFEQVSGGGKLTINRGPNRGFHVRIYVPENSGLDIDCSAGNLTLDRVHGNKDIELSAGNLKIVGSKPSDYSRVDASVTAGNVDAPGIGHKSGLFRSLRKNNSQGKYVLRARVTAGNIEIH